MHELKWGTPEEEEEIEMKKFPARNLFWSEENSGWL